MSPLWSLALPVAFISICVLCVLSWGPLKTGTVELWEKCCCIAAGASLMCFNDFHNFSSIGRQNNEFSMKVKFVTFSSTIFTRQGPAQWVKNEAVVQGAATQMGLMFESQQWSSYHRWTALGFFSCYFFLGKNNKSESVHKVTEWINVVYPGMWLLHVTGGLPCGLLPGGHFTYLKH